MLSTLQREDIFPRETGRVSALNGESQFDRGSAKDRGQLSIKTGDKIASREERHSRDVPGLEVD